ncbi:hypothetical protein CJF12_02325 [Chryseobacterium piperi]|uniref:hypothetical protein n=1 Tax=Chryseobacterium piperi TaxID=558152 RepID=UPI00068B6E7D|nr:hypothetical protein [Chryseobacterium piperi]ASW73240.2 hypothetical protein CJF12_02325 [Chryseobacterium piperi]
MKIDLEELRQSSLTIELEKKNNYLLSYPHFINYFKLKDRLSDKDLICGAFMIYGWMPTILKNVDCTKIDEILNLFNKAKTSDTLLTEIEIKCLTSFTNNSLVGASKLLHFINPSVYPIWDRKVCRYFFPNNNHNQVNKISNYLKYIETIQNIIATESCFHFDHIRNQMNYEITDIRLIEMLLFLTVKKKDIITDSSIK